MDCVTSNTEKIIKGDNFEIKLVECPNEYSEPYFDAITKYHNNKNVMELELLAEQEKTATKEEQIEINKKVKAFESETEDLVKLLRVANNQLVLGSLIGNCFDTGYFKINGVEKEINEDFIKKIPPKLYRLMVKASQELLIIQKEER